jgi:16S rRNA (cytidine1402-2'-O)-methyltransferase
MNRLLLLPNLLGEESSHEEWLSRGVVSAVESIDGLIAESERGGRRYLRRFSRHLPIKLLNEHSTDREIEALLPPQGESWGVISDCGLPCLADPGSKLVFYAKKRGIEIRALSGPSSLTLALMLSGLPAQRFTFHGYLPKDKKLLLKELKLMERESMQKGATQLFIEAPYRNERLFSLLCEGLSARTQLSIAWDLTLPGESVITQSIADWRAGTAPPIDGKPAIFLVRS